MKLLLYSDLHLEFSHGWVLPQNVNGDVLILTGDIITFKNYEPFKELLSEWNKPVLFVAGLSWLCSLAEPSGDVILGLLMVRFREYLVRRTEFDRNRLMIFVLRSAYKNKTLRMPVAVSGVNWKTRCCPPA